jgi:hypothetical protein
MRVRPRPTHPRIWARTPWCAASLPQNIQLLSVILGEACGAGCPCPVPHRRRMPVGRAAVPRLGRLGTAVANPSPPPAEQHCPQLSTRVDAGPPHRVSRGRRDRGQAGGRTPRRPSCPSSRRQAASITNSLAFAVPPRSDRSSPKRSRDRSGYPLLEPLTVPVSATVDAGLPRRAVCLAAGHDRQQTGCRSEACAQATRWCLIACLTPRTAVQEPRRRTNNGDGPRQASRTRGLPPLPSWSRAITRGVYPGRGPPLPGGRRGGVGSGVGSARRTPRGATRLGGKSYLARRWLVMHVRLCAS